ncbi:MAG: hypothetical protein HOQ36_04580 [Nocardia sp.]|nr:hypothetical protein [Nocardia sp.]
MERGSSKHGPARDDQMAHELQGTLRGNRSGAAEWLEPEPPADDDRLVNERVDRPERRDDI